MEKVSGGQVYVSSSDNKIQEISGGVIWSGIYLENMALKGVTGGSIYAHSDSDVYLNLDSSEVMQGEQGIFYPDGQPLVVGGEPREISTLDPSVLIFDKNGQKLWGKR